jgi:hypothetical protein
MPPHSSHKRDDPETTHEFCSMILGSLFSTRLLAQYFLQISTCCQQEVGRFLKRVTKRTHKPFFVPRTNHVLCPDLECIYFSTAPTIITSNLGCQNWTSQRTSKLFTSHLIYCARGNFEKCILIYVFVCKKIQ